MLSSFKRVLKKTKKEEKQGGIETPHNSTKMKYVLVTGGVVSGLGKGVTASSIGLLLKACGLRVTAIKIGMFLFIFLCLFRLCVVVFWNRKLKHARFLSSLDLYEGPLVCFVYLFFSLTKALTHCPFCFKH